MDEQSFINALLKQNITLNDKQLAQFEQYYTLLYETNKHVNLTAITDKKEVYLKHFYDSITPSFYFSFEPEMKLCDIGAGAGFPSIPLLIVFPEIHVTIVDSLNKRISFLEELISRLGLAHVDLIHGRAEDIGRAAKYREQFSIVTARAVAGMSVLAEYCLPLCKLGGTFIALKGANAEEELTEAKKSLTLLGGGKIEHHSFRLPAEESERSVIFVKKRQLTPKKYPRKAGVPTKMPLK